MKGITSEQRSAITKSIEDLFDNLALEFIGELPRLKNAKRLVISGKKNLGLSNLFIQSIQNRNPTTFEQDFLKSLLESTDGYIESLKSKTKSNVVEKLDGLFRQAGFQKREVTEPEIQDVLQEELDKAKSHFMLIIESESTKIRNLGTMMQIATVASSIGDENPTVFFIVVKDKSTCKECLRLHLMPDQETPRLWKFSELKQVYHKRGGESPSIFGLHPHCKCTLTYLTKGFGFKNGKLTYKNEDFDEYKEQRKD